ncbi:response regulator [Cytophagaceae bacterium ABcell3]|nr:response regulator [Cytophagaceae bacterium ABcell3]
MNNKNILIVEDDIVFCKMLNKFLNKNSYLADDAQTAEEAIEVMQNKHYDIAIIDYRLPGKNGIELLEWIKDNQKSTKVFMVSRTDDKQIADKALQLGAKEYINKPIDPAELLGKIKSLNTESV